jgi:hypothetical protein
VVEKLFEGVMPQLVVTTQASRQQCRRRDVCSILHQAICFELTSSAGFLFSLGSVSNTLEVLFATLAVLAFLSDQKRVVWLIACGNFHRVVIV